MSLFIYFDYVMREEQRHSSERNQHCIRHQSILRPHCPCFRGSPERKITWTVLEVCNFFCHLVTEQWGWQCYGYLMDTHTAIWWWGTVLMLRQESSWEQDVKSIKNTRGTTARQVSTEKHPGIITNHNVNMNHWCCLFQKPPKPECHSKHWDMKTRVQPTRYLGVILSLQFPLRKPLARILNVVLGTSQGRLEQITIMQTWKTWKEISLRKRRQREAVADRYESSL